MLDIEQIEELIASRQFQQLKYFQEKTNVFTIVGQTHTEHWHSSFMRWLLDPHSSLCLGHYPPNLPKLLYIGSKPIPQTAYKINDCGSFFFTNICINDII